MATLDDRTEPLSVSYHSIVRPQSEVRIQPAMFSLRSLFGATTAFAIYFGLVTSFPASALQLTPLLGFALTLVYFTRHHRLCFGRAMILGVVFGTISAGAMPIALSLVGIDVPGSSAFFLNSFNGFLLCGSAAFVAAIGTVLIEACTSR